jgi:amidase
MCDEPLPPTEPEKPENIRLAENNYDRDQVSGAQISKYEAVFNSLRSDGVHIEEVTHAHTSCQSDVMRCEFKRDLEDYLANSAAKRKTLNEIISFYEADPERMMKYGDSILRGALDGASGRLDDEAYLAAMKKREQLRAEILDNLRDFDACVMTGPTDIMHFAGLPSLAIRLGMGGDGMPRGMILYGADMRRLFAAALTVEKYCAPVTMPKL